MIDGALVRFRLGGRDYGLGRLEGTLLLGLPFTLALRRLGRAEELREGALTHAGAISGH